MYLKELTELRGVPGAEDEVREFIFDKIKIGNFRLKSTKQARKDGD